MKYVVLGAGNELSRYTWLDIISRSDVTYINEMYDLKGAMKLLHKIHCSLRINSVVNLPFKNLWWRYCKFNNINFDKETYLILGDTAFGKSDLAYLNMIRNKYKLKVLVVLLNPVSSISKDLKQKIDKMDVILTSDLEDSKSYGYPYIPTVYSKAPINLICEDNIDLFFVGADKGRLNILLKCFDKFKNENIKNLFYIFNVKKKFQKYSNEINYNTYLSYQSILNKVNNSNCIFEVLQHSQTGITYRTMEAVCYNKKLLTNNANIKNFEFYNPKYIKIFNNPEDIDTNFIKEKISVDYGYSNEYSPINIIKFIEEIEEKKGRVLSTNFS